MLFHVFLPVPLLYSVSACRVQSGNNLPATTIRIQRESPGQFGWMGEHKRKNSRWWWGHPFVNDCMCFLFALLGVFPPTVSERFRQFRLDGRAARLSMIVIKTTINLKVLRYIAIITSSSSLSTWLSTFSVVWGARFLYVCPFLPCEWNELVHLNGIPFHDMAGHHVETICCCRQRHVFIDFFALNSPRIMTVFKTEPKNDGPWSRLRDKTVICG